MNRKTLDQTLARMEHHLECWKQFNDYMSLARSKKFGQEDETQFLEIKCVLTQEFELILAQLENLPITREEAHTLIAAAPSIRYLSELNEANLKTLENQWHKMFINWQAVLGQLKVRREDLESQGMFRSLFGKKERPVDK
ncbi:MAG: hypothetical protein JNN07_21010 [Verrucomicrobiales bacterium]|jgi:hypothetical protein|nr:hypothetical protein [Verrucomicrobiales bacterium]